MNTKILGQEGLLEAAKALREDKVVAVPTETVYGLCANGLSERAVERIYEAKGRPENKPVSLFVTDIKAAEEFCRNIPEAAYKLAEKFWPGPLTMIFERRENVPDIITAGGNTVGIRCPDNEMALELLRLCGVPITGTSANLSGMPNANDIDEVMEYFNGRIEYAVDGGRCAGGVPSTIFDMTVEPYRILREGGITKKELEDIAGAVII